MPNIAQGQGKYDAHLFAQVESRAISKVYLARLYFAAFAVLSVIMIFIAAAAASLPFPYMRQPMLIDDLSWSTRFETNTLKIISLPLLFGAMLSMWRWPATRLSVAELDNLYFLTQRKKARLSGGITMHLV